MSFVYLHSEQETNRPIETWKLKTPMLKLKRQLLSFYHKRPLLSFYHKRQLLSFYLMYSSIGWSISCFHGSVCFGIIKSIPPGLKLTKMGFTLTVFLLLLWVSSSTSETINDHFIQCMTIHSTPYANSTQIIHQPNSSFYSHFLQSSQQNSRRLNLSTLKPLLILTPFHESEIQAAILCCKKQVLQIRTLSGGHDYEGLSYLSQAPFIIIDLIHLRTISINIEDETAWVQAGATLGELYYSVSIKSRVHGFPAGICPTVGVGGHFSGGGFGTLLRKYGLAADNILDASLIDVNGRILNRESMGEDLFWAVKGGGGASFGIIVSWKIKLVQVPPTVTVFSIDKTLEQGLTKLVHRWQYVADRLHEDLFIRVIIQNVGKKKTIQASFNSLFLGGVDKLIPLMGKSFPQLGLQAGDCTEMTWIESVLYFAGFPRGTPLEILLNRTHPDRSFFKAKSDYVKEAIPEAGLEGVWERFLKEEIVFMIMDPYGGRMNEISEYEIPFPHRKGNLYNIQYLVKWEDNEAKISNEHLHWIRMLYKYMRPYVSKSPRAAYFNYRDLDLGSNNQDNYTSYSQGWSWGRKYFKGNFFRLAWVKTKVDPTNFFRNEQTIPPLPGWRIRRRYD